MRITIAEHQLVGEAKLDARHAVGDLASHELNAAAR